MGIFVLAVVLLFFLTHCELASHILFYILVYIIWFYVLLLAVFSPMLVWLALTYTAFNPLFSMVMLQDILVDA